MRRSGLSTRASRAWLWLALAPLPIAAQPTGEAQPNATLPFADLATWQGRADAQRIPLSFRVVDSVPARAFAPPSQRRDGLEPRAGAALEWVENPRQAFGGSGSAAALVLFAGMQYEAHRPTWDARLDASGEALKSNSDDLEVATLDAATISAMLRGRPDERGVWEYNGLVQRTHEPSGGLPVPGREGRYRTDFIRQGLDIGWRLAPRLDLFGSAELASARSSDPLAVDVDSDALGVGLRWRRLVDQRLSTTVRSRHVDFENAPGARANGLQLQWEQQWTPTWVTELAIGVARVQGDRSLTLWRAATTQTFRSGSWTCAAERDLDAPGWLGRLTDIRRGRCDVEWRVSDSARATMGLEGTRYALGTGGQTLQTLHPRASVTWPLNPSQWVSLRWTATEDRVGDPVSRRRDQRLQAIFVHTFAPS